jgi:hypothetical protein
LTLELGSGKQNLSRRQQTKRGTATITYWIVVNHTAEFTPFQGFARAVIELTPSLHRIATLPSSIFELYADKLRAGFGRMHGVGAYRIIILNQSHLQGLSLYPANPFSVFISDAQTFDAIEKYRCSSPFPLLHATTADRPGKLKLDSLERDHLRTLFGSVISFLEASGEPEMVLLPKPDADLVKWEPEPVRLPELEHGVTIPNEMALKSLGFRLAHGEPLPALVEGLGGLGPGNVNMPIIHALIASVDAVRIERKQFADQRNGPPAGPPIDTIIWAAGVESHLANPIPHNEKVPDPLKAVLRALLRQRDYPGISNQSPASFREIHQSAECRAAIKTRKLELQLCTAALGVMAAGHFAPVIRVRPAVNLVRGQIKQLSGCASGAGPRKVMKLSKIARAIGATLVEEIGQDCISLIEHSGEGMKLVSNAPLELLPIRGLPVQLRFTASRVPITPGNVFLTHLIGDSSVHVSASDLRDVLIIRAFKKDDPIRNILARVSEYFLAQSRGSLNVQVVDVESASAFIDAVNSFSGRILIFDGHGYEKEGLGQLRIGSESVHPLELAGKIHRMPPIVVLSACSTHPLEWSEGSSATAFLIMGATCVLATVTPISARDAAVFTGRLLMRLADFVPLVAGSNQRWSDVITGLLRMTYATDLIRTFESARKLNGEDARTIHVEANITINSRKTDWFETLLSTISKRLGIALSEVEKFWLENAYFTSALQYVHLGSPEQIVIVQDRDKREVPSELPRRATDPSILPR